MYFSKYYSDSILFCMISLRLIFRIITPLIANYKKTVSDETCLLFREQSEFARKIGGLNSRFSSCTRPTPTWSNCRVIEQILENYYTSVFVFQFTFLEIFDLRLFCHSVLLIHSDALNEKTDHSFGVLVMVLCTRITK